MPSLDEARVSRDSDQGIEEHGPERYDFEYEEEVHVEDERREVEESSVRNLEEEFGEVAP